jgi:hypothetical protein
MAKKESPIQTHLGHHQTTGFSHDATTINALIQWKTKTTNRK